MKHSPIKSNKTSKTGVDFDPKLDFDFLNLLNNLFVKSTHEPQKFF